MRSVNFDEKIILNNIISFNKVEKGYTVSGSPLIIELVDNPDVVVDTLKSKFGLITIISKNNNSYALYCVDLHTGFPFEVEVFENMLVCHFVKHHLFKNDEIVYVVKNFINNCLKHFNVTSIYFESGVYLFRG